MKSTGKALWLGLGAAACAGAGLAFLVAPGRSREAQRKPFAGRYFAHRGLYDPAAGIPENSLAAFRAAAERGYGAEMDVRLTADGVAVVSHDADLTRMTAQGLVVEESDYAELLTLRLGGTEERIPRFTDAMDILCGAGVPVIVEVKQPAKGRLDETCRAVLSELDAREGEFCVESFDPTVLLWFRRHAPELLRGQLTACAETLNQGPVLGFLLSRVMFNFLSRPQFIAHQTGRKSLPVRLAELLGAMRVCWTAKDRREEARNDVVIFENFLPPVRFL